MRSIGVSLAHLCLGLALCFSPLACKAASAGEVRIKLGQSRTVALTDPNGQKARIHFRFSRMSNGIMLEVKNLSNFMLTYDATICLAKRKHCETTSTIPVQAKLMSFEAWPPGGDVLILSGFTSGP